MGNNTLLQSVKEYMNAMNINTKVNGKEISAMVLEICDSRMAVYILDYLKRDLSTGIKHSYI